MKKRNHLYEVHMESGEMFVAMASGRELKKVFKSMGSGKLFRLNSLDGSTAVSINPSQVKFIIWRRS